MGWLALVLVVVAWVLIFWFGMPLSNDEDD
jgi:hypothetical protein